MSLHRPGFVEPRCLPATFTQRSALSARAVDPVLDVKAVRSRLLLRALRGLLHEIDIRRVEGYQNKSSLISSCSPTPQMRRTVLSQ